MAFRKGIYILQRQGPILDKPISISLGYISDDNPNDKPGTTNSTKDGADTAQSLQEITEVISNNDNNLDSSNHNGDNSENDNNNSDGDNDNGESDNDINITVHYVHKWLPQDINTMPFSSFPKDEESL